MSKRNQAAEAAAPANADVGKEAFFGHNDLGFDVGFGDCFFPPFFSCVFFFLLQDLKSFQLWYRLRSGVEARLGRQGGETGGP